MKKNARVKKVFALFFAFMFMASAAMSATGFATGPRRTDTDSSYPTGEKVAIGNSGEEPEASAPVSLGESDSIDKAAVLNDTGRPSDVITYNLGNREVEVSWPSLGQSDEGGKFFNQDGSYTIQLEDNAFFPYEVQFRVDGKTTTNFFETPDSTLNIGGHKISVSSERSDPYAITRIGFNVGGEYVAATPERKTFTNTLKPGTRSLLPLTRIEVDVDLTDKTPFELKSVEVSAFIDNINLTSSPPVDKNLSIYWDYVFNEYDRRVSDSFERITDKPFDLNKGSIVNTNRIQMIVGTPNQLDTTNTRYIINITQNEEPYFDVSLYSRNDLGEFIRLASADEEGEYIAPGPEAEGESPEMRAYAPILNYVARISDSYPLESEYYLNVSDHTYYAGSPSYDIVIYKGAYINEQEAINSGAENIASQVMSRDNLQYKANFSAGETFTVIYKFKGTEYFAERFHLSAQHSTSSRIVFAGMYTETDGRRSNVADNRKSEEDQLTGIRTYYVTLDSGCYVDKEYYAGFSLSSGVVTNNTRVTKAVVGHYYYLGEAATQPDIKDQLMVDNMYSTPNSGYLANYKNGVRFTIFIGDEVYRYNVIALENPGSGSTYLQVDGATGVSADHVYKVQLKDDSGADQFGYQILLVDDQSVDLSTLKPTFKTMDGIDAYVKTQKQVSGTTEQDFSAEKPIQYSARAENGADVKNYWVSFAKAKTDPTLFVVVDGEKPGEREVFFNAYTKNRHDIFIANIGGQPLTGLNVQLESTTIALDDYWVVGGDGNNTLAPFTTASGTNNELSNIAKIRLISNDNEEREVSGKLIISADNVAENVVLELKGTAGNPHITTETLNDHNAVRYVPYSALIQTDNKYSWNKALFSMVSGKLPAGMILRPSGEIYGVPTEAGTFTFEVRATYSYDDFDDSYKEFTLTVLENSKENVDGAVDSGYGVMDRVGGDEEYLGNYQEALFRSEGGFNEFMDFWIDGKKMVKGVDYDAEEGSTAITIRSKTFEAQGPGTHTIAAEFRVDGNVDDTLKRAAQNYSISYSTDPDVSTGGNSSSSDYTGKSTVDNPTIYTGKAAVKDAAQAVRRDILRTRLINEDFISLQRLQTLAVEAGRENMSAWLDVDTINPGSAYVDVRVGISPHLASDGVNMAANTDNANARKTRQIYEKFFKNKMLVVINFSQQGNFGQKAIICAKVPEGTNAEDLVFYSYNTETNRYAQLTDINAWIDENGFVHFKTDSANDIIISVGELTSK